MLAKFFLAVVISVAAPFSAAMELEPVSSERLNYLLSELKHVPLKTRVDEIPNGIGSGCVFTKATIPVTSPKQGHLRNQDLFIARPKGSKRSPAILILPTIFGHTVLENQLAKKLCERGFATVIADVNEVVQPTTLPSWDHEDNTQRKAILTLRTAIDFMQMHPYILPNQIASLGCSLGAITTATLMGVDTRLRAAVLAAGGGNLPFILANSRYSKIELLRESRMKHLKISIPEYENELRRRLIFDPLHFRSRVNSANILMMIAKGDTMVPESAQMELWENYGQPEVLLFGSGHVGSIVRLAILWTDYIAEFFRARFGARVVSGQ